MGVGFWVVGGLVWCAGWGCGFGWVVGRRLCVLLVCVEGFGVEVSLGSSRPLSVRFDCGFERPRLILPRVAVCLDAGAVAPLTGERRGQGDASFGWLVFGC